ncbi:mannose-6-phosphate isomerase, class I [Pasteurella multocida]|uniref:mannose-6-phosphate isomerase, class I n=1 Tax=Pasteurella multocida TaxID=747 RepID=UPI001CE22FC7|nr:mannose-6-phosphate isomerase, class I [Pasteurella multocida]UBU76499.1 mannose-6-phosphate isomerase, class I [Pasteurella multocida]UZT14589.1 mannose-6-phosphate isomerase, class I [Pasteurella multocida]UZT17128.1 mannose-6-phosphate isomerase, class I [Pasteurella multocida]UZU33181.1 mannose-6-phosphate isomerase, class I [Pasteurella multocida]UZU37838.1 mannose-6-phosphate isomerase, class I [Pasteurella multocida]
MGIYQLTGRLQHYVWGGKDYLPALLGMKKETEQYYAEWWLGAHVSAPSMLDVEGKETSLATFLAQKPTALGDKSLSQFGSELPYLLKILDVAKPLSIQLHPTKKQAEIGFAQENAQGIALTSPIRTYKDNNHKPEMMIALSDFWLLHGFKTKQTMLATLNARPSLQGLATKLVQQDMHAFYADIMQADQEQLSQWLLPIIEENKAKYAANQLELSNPDYWVLYTMEAMGIAPSKLDAGLVCFYLFNIVHLREGEGIFQDAGIPHAYLRGQNIELMACSDNVIRGGLTPKHVDIQALLAIIDCREVVPEIIPVVPAQQAYFTYHTPAKDFALTRFNYCQGQTQSCQAQSAQILLVMKGKLTLSQGTQVLELKQGESAFIESETSYQITGLEEGYCVISALP